MVAVEGEWVSFIKRKEIMMENIDEIVSRLNEIQANVYRGISLTAGDRFEWRNLANEIHMAGYVLRKKRVKNAYGRVVACIWRAVPMDGLKTRTRHFSAPLKKIDMTPNDGMSTCKGNCTTRAMAYCLQGVFSYREIEHEQYRKAEEMNAKAGLFHGDYRRKKHRNTNGVWDSIMTDLGYVWVVFRKTIRRDRLAIMLNSIPYPLITSSSSHVAVIENGAVIDSWDSRHGRCFSVLVKSEDAEKVVLAVGSHGISSSIGKKCV